MKQFLFHIKEDTIRKDYIQFLQELEGEERRLLLVGVINDIARYVVEPNNKMRDCEREFLMDLLRLFPVRTAEEEELVSAAWLESFVRLMDISYINHITIMDGVYIDCDAVERIATLHQREYGRYRGVSCGVCKDTIDRIMTFFDPEGLTDEVVKRWVIESQEIIGSNGAFLLRALYVHLINEHLVSVMNYTFLLDYLKCLLEYWWRQKWDRRDGSLEGKTKALVDEAMALYRGLSLEQKNEVITNNEICKMSHDPKEEYLIAYFATGRSFSVSELTELKYTGVDDGDEDIKQILQAVMDDNFRSIIEEVYDDGKGDIRRIAETLEELLWAARRNWRSVIKNDPEVYTMFLAYSVMKDKKLSATDADILFEQTCSYALTQWLNIDVTWRIKRALVAINSVAERNAYYSRRLGLLPSGEEIWGKVSDDALMRIIKDSESLNNAYGAVIDEVLRRSYLREMISYIIAHTESGDVLDYVIQHAAGGDALSHMQLKEVLLYKYVYLGDTVTTEVDDVVASYMQGLLVEE